VVCAADREGQVLFYKHVAALTEKGHLVRHGAGRGTWYAMT
jgi:hypothetical protein